MPLVTRHKYVAGNLEIERSLIDYIFVLNVLFFLFLFLLELAVYINMQVKNLSRGFAPDWAEAVCVKSFLSYSP